MSLVCLEIAVAHNDLFVAVDKLKLQANREMMFNKLDYDALKMLGSGVVVDWGKDGNHEGWGMPWRPTISTSVRCCCCCRFVSQCCKASAMPWECLFADGHRIQLGDEDCAEVALALA